MFCFFRSVESLISDSHRTGPWLEQKKGLQIEEQIKPLYYKIICSITSILVEKPVYRGMGRAESYVP